MKSELLPVYGWEVTVVATCARWRTSRSKMLGNHQPYPDDAPRPQAVGVWSGAAAGTSSNADHTQVARWLRTTAHEYPDYSKASVQLPSRR